MAALEASGLLDGALLLVDSAPIIYILEDHPRLAARFRPLFERHENGRLVFAVTTMTIAEVLTGPFKSGNEVLAKRYRSAMESWQVVSLTADVAESAARFRARYGLGMADAVQAASAIAIGADALVTHDRDFSGIPSLRVLM